jgi:tetratricopeptide (TPR) repeat protein
VSSAALAVCVLLAFGNWSRWWGMLTAGTDNGILTFLDRADKISSILSGVVSAAALMIALAQGGRNETAAAQHDSGSGRVQQLVRFFVDRDDESHQLRRALTDRRTRVIVVHGAAGVGKTELVEQVTRKAGIDARWDLATPSYSPNADTILRELLTSGPDPDEMLLTADPSPGGLLEAVLRARKLTRQVIVLDAVERLVGDNGHFTDLALDEALELIATGPRHGVKIVLISSQEPRAASGGQWAATARRIFVQKLPLEHFRTFVSNSAGERTDLLASLDQNTLADVYHRVGGRPRLAQLFDEIVEIDTGTTARSLAAELQKWAGPARDVDYVGDRLRQRMTESFPAYQQHVYRAVAALGTPVEADTVAAVVDEVQEPENQLGTDGVRRELLRLSRHAIHTDRAERTFFLSTDEARRALNWRTEPNPAKAKADRRLLERAAEALRQRRQADRYGDWANPQALLAEVDVWLRAELWDAALRSIEEMDRHAETGSPAMLFRKARQRIAEQIDPIHQPANYSVVGYLYHASGDFRRARDAYDKALALIRDDQPTWKASVLVNVAGLEWSTGSPESAFDHFNHARNLAPDDPVVTAGALAGMARCRRRQGQFTAAASLLGEALQAAGNEPGRMIPIAVRLLRLHIDQDRLQDSEGLIELIGEAADHGGDDSLRATHLDALADLRLAQGRHREAMRAAQSAVRLALPVHDPVTALQARSTISMLRIYRQDFTHAAHEATLARRYSGTGLLIVIALQCVALRHTNDPAEAQRVVQELIAQAEDRTGRYGGDFAAWLFLGLGRCAKALETATGSMDTAIDAFKEAREPTDEHARRHPPEPAPAITRQMLVLLRNLATDDTERRRLQPAVDHLEQALTEQQATRATTTGDS